MLTENQIQAYCERIAYAGPRDASSALLLALHQAHLQRIAFENLDISLGKRLDLSPAALLHKLVLQKRGGFCYELNHLFGLLLESLGFTVSRLSAQVFNGRDYGPDFDHMLLLVMLDGESWLADVGFGDSFRSPLPLSGKGVHELGMHYFLQTDGGQQLVLMQARDGGAAHPQYRFHMHPHLIQDFAEMCLYQQTSPASHFTQKSICSIATPDGRISVSNNKCISTSGTERQVHTIVDESDYRRILLRHFDMSLPVDADIRKLMSRH